MSKKKIKVELDASTWRWIRALARSQKPWDGRKVTPGELLACGALAIANAAGQRTGSWEAECGRQLLEGQGYEDGVREDFAARLRFWDEQDNTRARNEWAKKKAAAEAKA